MNRCLLIGVICFVGCGGDDTFYLEELGGSNGAMLTVIADTSNGLNEPRDLAFNPLRPEELWIVNYADDSTVIVADAPQDSRSSEKRIDAAANHFMEEVTAIDFGQDETTFGLPGTFATCGESVNTYNGSLPGGNNFMGPALWSSDLTVYAVQNPNGGGSHLDMLHNTPLCMGITHEKDNIYWVVGGFTNSIERYDFVLDDGIGNDNHRDGKTWRYAKDEMGYVEGVPNHLDLDNDSGWLYVADPAKGRVVRLDTRSGSEGRMTPGLETSIQYMDDAVLEEFIPQKIGEVELPSGIELHDGYLFVSDRRLNKISAYDLDGTLLDSTTFEFGVESLSGFTFGPDNRIYFVDTPGNKVYRIDPIE